MLAIEIGIVAALIVLNGLLAMSELAVVSSRRARLKSFQQQGMRSAERAIALAAAPGRFLSTVQIGITLVGVLSGAFSGATLGRRLADLLVEYGLAESLAATLGMGVVVTIITYFSLIVGELVPKQIALRNPERIAMLVAPAMTVLSRIASPLVWLLDMSGRGLLRLLGQSDESAQKVTDEEIRAIIAEAEHHGTIESDERRMIAGVMRLGDRPVRAIMTPRTEVDWLDLAADRAAMRRVLTSSQHSRLPVGEGSVENLIGVVQTRALLSAFLSRKPFDPLDFVQRAPIVHDNADALDVLATLKEADVPMALVHDEYGSFEGLVTPADALETIVGVFRADAGEDSAPAVERDDGSWLLAGYMQADEMADLLGIKLPLKRDYETVAGLVLAQLHHLPETGETVDAYGWRFEVVDLDGRRIDKLIATKLNSTRRKAGT